MIEDVSIEHRNKRGKPQHLRDLMRSWINQKMTEHRANRRLVLGDLCVVALAVIAALWVSLGAPLDFAAPGLTAPRSHEARGPYGVALLLIALPVSLIVFSLAGFYRRHTRSTSLRDITILLRGAMLAIALQALISATLPLLQGLPFSLLLVQFLITVPGLGALRIIARRRELMRKSQRARHAEEATIPVLLVGTGTNCDLFLRSIRNTNSRYLPVGIIDDVRDALGLYFHYVKIVGSVRDADAAIAAVTAGGTLPKQLILTEDSSHFDRDGIQALLDWARENQIQVARLPGLSEPEVTDDIHTGTTQPAAALRSVDPEQILERPQKAVEKSLLRALFHGRRVLITGAGGSIGSELARQVAAFDPSLLVLIDNCEFNAYSVDMDLNQHFPDVPRHVHVASVRDLTRIRAIFRQHRPELVFNAAALKHVPMVEMNPCEGVLTNVIGTRNVADCTREVGAAAMVQISTDKAVNTTNVMGASKRVAEFYVQGQDRITNETREQTRFFSVRFGNVLGSSGSLVPLFQRQISEGGPLTVTDRRMERFFMTIREAVELTLVAAARGLDQQAGLGEIFVLDMGKPVRIVDLAERMIRLAGLEPYQDIDINFIGIRPGEKLFEELFDSAETRHDSGMEGVQSARPDGIPIAQLRAAILRLEEAARRGDEAALRSLLYDLVPGYGQAMARQAATETLPLSERLSAAQRSRLPHATRRPVAGPGCQPGTRRVTPVTADPGAENSAELGAELGAEYGKEGRLWIGE